MILTFLCIAAIYLFLDAEFIAVIQVLIYAGAIMVLFLFVIMLLNVGERSVEPPGRRFKKAIAAALGTAILVPLIVGIETAEGVKGKAVIPKSIGLGTVEETGKQLFTTYLFPFEIVSVLLLAAIVGVVILAKKKLE